MSSTISLRRKIVYYGMGIATLSVVVLSMSLSSDKSVQEFALAGLVCGISLGVLPLTYDTTATKVSNRFSVIFYAIMASVPAAIVVIASLSFILSSQTEFAEKYLITNRLILTLAVPGTLLATFLLNRDTKRRLNSGER